MVFFFGLFFRSFFQSLPRGFGHLYCCSALYFPGAIADSGRFFVAALPSTDALRPAPAVAALLNASVSEDSHRGPYQEA
jgi:hypothetical protein